MYQLHGPRNNVRSFREFEADEDATAIAECENWRDSNAMELWSGRRKVRRWEEMTKQA
jgi:hypothetical protein